MRKTLTGVLAALAFVGLALGAARAQDYPTRPVKIFIAFPVGGLLDTVSRIVGEKLGDLLGQQFVIEARPGAGGTIATLAVAKADPDCRLQCADLTEPQSRPGRHGQHVPTSLGEPYGGLQPTFGQEPQLLLLDRFHPHRSGAVPIAGSQPDSDMLHRVREHAVDQTVVVRLRLQTPPVPTPSAMSSARASPITVIGPAKIS